MAIANQIKVNYKKLYEYQKSAKLAEEIFSISGNQKDMDEEFLLQMRGQLTEGKDFSENYLKMLMDSTFQIKNKEDKVDKILGIIGEITT